MKIAIIRSVAFRGAALLITFASLSTTAHAALQDSDPFNYSGTALDAQNGGTGWSNGWFTTGTASANTLSNDGVSLAYPVSFESPLTTPATTGSRISTGGTATNASTSRLLAAPIDLSQEGNVRYVSALFKKTAANGGGVNNDNVLIEFVTSGTAARRLGLGIEGTTDKPWLNHNGSTTPPAGGAVTPGDTYFMVAKVISRASTNDEYFLKVFGTGYGSQVPVAEPVAWDVSVTQATDAILDRIRVRIDPGNTASTPGQVDEIRIGDTWASVVGVSATFDPADFNEDGDVDGEDLAEWESDFGGPGSDADDDDDSDGNDFLIWQRNLTPAEASIAATSVPEPASAALVAFAAAIITVRRVWFAA